MNTSRRALLAAAGTLASADLAAASASPSTIDRDVSELVQRSAASNAALMRGDIERYSALVSYSDDFTLMSPFGGTPSHGRDLTPERMKSIGRFFRNGHFRQEVVQTYGSADMVVLALIEHAHVEVGGLPAQNWSLRVTLVYRRDGAEWKLAHRHADPLSTSITVEHSAALARGER